jgi:hypothetical protein
MGGTNVARFPDNGRSNRMVYARLLVLLAMVWLAGPLAATLRAVPATAPMLSSPQSTFHSFVGAK